MLVNANGPNTEDNLREAAEAAAALGKQFKALTVTVEADFPSAFASLEELKHPALIIQTDPFIDAWVERLIPLAARYVVPAIYGFRRFRPHELRGEYRRRLSPSRRICRENPSCSQAV